MRKRREMHKMFCYSIGSGESWPGVRRPRSDHDDKHQPHLVSKLRESGTVCPHRHLLQWPVQRNCVQSLNKPSRVVTPLQSDMQACCNVLLGVHMIAVNTKNRGPAYCKSKGKDNVVPARAITYNSLSSTPDAEELSASRLHCCAAPLEESPPQPGGPQGRSGRLAEN